MRICTGRLTYLGLGDAPRGTRSRGCILPERQGSGTEIVRWRSDTAPQPLRSAAQFISGAAD